MHTIFQENQMNVAAMTEDNWSKRGLLRPSIQSTMQKMKKNFDFDDVLGTFTHCKVILENQPKLEHAAALASRLISRRAHAFRVQPSFMYFRKMNISLCRLKELNIYDDIRDMQKAIEIAKTAGKLDKKCYLPAKENFHYYLSEFRSFTKLLIRIVMCARESHKLFLDIIYRSAFIEIISLFMAVLSDIWTICIDMCKSAVRFYNEFYQFYASNYDRSSDLPECLDEWLANDYKEFIDVTVDGNSTSSGETYFLFDGNDSTERKPIDVKIEPKLLIQTRIFDDKMKKDMNAIEKNVGKQNATVKMFSTQDWLKNRDLKIDLKKKSMETKQKIKLISNKQNVVDLGEKISRSNS